MAVGILSGKNEIYSRNVIEKLDLSQIPFKGIRDCSTTVGLRVRYVDGKVQLKALASETPVVCQVVEAEVKKSTE